MIKNLLFAVTLLSAVAFTACSKQAAVAKVYPLEGKTLHLVSLAGMDYDSSKMARPVSLNFLTDTKVAGSTGCNLVNGTYTIGAGVISFSDKMASTMMMCDEASNNVERAMLDLFGEANRYTVENGLMSVYNGEELLGVFRIAETLN